VFVDGLNCCF